MTPVGHGNHHHLSLESGGAPHGTLLGHIAPGTMFSLWGVFTVLVAWHRHHRSLVIKNASYLTTCHFLTPPHHQSLSGWRLMAKALLIILPLIGMALEMWNARFGGWPTNLQHTVMYGAFVIHLAVDLLMPNDKFLTPDGINYLTLSTAFSIEAYLFGNHLHGRNMLDRKLHICLTVAILANTLGVVAEALMTKRDVRPVVVRGCLTIWQGLWFIHIGVTSWPLPLLGDLLVWDHHDSHANMMHTDTIFIAQLLMTAIFGLVSGKVVEWRVKKVDVTENGSKLYMQLSTKDEMMDSLMLEDAA